MSNYTIVIACLCLNASEYRVYMHKKQQQQQQNYFKNYLFFSDTEYRKFLSESYEYEYEEYLIRIIMDLINLKILKQHLLVLQKRLQ